MALLNLALSSTVASLPGTRIVALFSLRRSTADLMASAGVAIRLANSRCSGSVMDERQSGEGVSATGAATAPAAASAPAAGATGAALSAPGTDPATGAMASGTAAVISSTI